MQKSLNTLRESYVVAQIEIIINVIVIIIVNHILRVALTQITKTSLTMSVISMKIRSRVIRYCSWISKSGIKACRILLKEKLLFYCTVEQIL